MAPTESTEKFSMDYHISSKGVSWSKVKIVIVVFIIALLAVGLMSGLLADKYARKEVEEKYSKQKLEGNCKSTTKTPVTTEVPTPTTSTTTTKPSCVGKWCNVRLPKEIVPYHYNLELMSDVENLKYNGTQEILFNVLQPINVVIVHVKEKIITSVNLKPLGGTSTFKVKRHFAYPENEFYVTEFESDIPKGRYSFTIKFNSNISKTLTGYYKSSYDNEQKVLLTTKFQPTDARRAFPCLDEPDLKATFNVTMTHPDTYHARSNMPGKVTGVYNGWRTTKFEKTVKMSTYLICFIVSQFTSKFEGTTGNQNMTIAIWSQPGLVNSTEYAYKTSIKMMDFLEDFLGVNYPMPKLDMFAIPDYGSGATEHWGIITYRESRLLYTPGISSEGNKASSAGIIAHECAHLWFGNLVTCKWWNDLWVQEGMASYMENYALNYTHPEWNRIDGFLTGDWKTGMTLDAYASSHPISQEVDHPKKIKEIFDSITYNKGASLFQMLDYYLGVDKFREGLKKYLLENEYKGATVEDLWRAFDTVSGQDITSMMNTWTHQMGHPVITISKTNDGFLMSQKHFLIDPQANVTQKSDYNYQWIIPFTYATNDKITERKTMVFKEKTETLKSNAKWILGNFNHRGFYRINYDKKIWISIIETLNAGYTTFEPIDRAGLIDDAFTLARAGETDYSIALNMLSFIDNDKTSMVWSMALDNLDFLDNILSSTNAYSSFRSFIAKKIQKVLNPNDWHSGYLRTAAKAGEETSVNYITSTFKKWMENGDEIPPNLRSTVLYHGVAYGGDKEWNYVFDKFRKETNPSLRSKYQSALSATQKPWILNKWLRFSIDPSIVKTQDTVYVIGAIASSNPIGKYLAWNFASAHWNEIMEIAKENNFHVAYVTSRLTSQFTTKYDLQMTEELWSRFPDAGTGANARAQGLEKIKGYIYWLDRNYDTLETWLKQNQ